MNLGSWCYLAGTIVSCIGLVRGVSMGAVGFSLVLLGGTMLTMLWAGE